MPFSRSQVTAASTSPPVSCERLLAVHHARAGAVAQGLDVLRGDRRGAHDPLGLGGLFGRWRTGSGRVVGVGPRRRGAGSGDVPFTLSRWRGRHLGVRRLCGTLRVDLRPAALGDGLGDLGLGDLAVATALGLRRGAASRRPPRPPGGPAPRPRAARGASASARAPLLGLAARALLLLAEERLALLHDVADRVGDERARADRVVVAGDDEVDAVRVAVRVDQADDRDAQALRLADRDHLGLEVDDEHRVRRALHVLHAAEVRAQLREVGLRGQPLARRQQLELALASRSARGRAGA